MEIGVSGVTVAVLEAPVQHGLERQLGIVMDQSGSGSGAEQIIKATTGAMQVSPPITQTTDRRIRRPSERVMGLAAVGGCQILHSANALLMP